MSDIGIILIGGALCALGLVWPGALLRYSRRYHWIAGYNSASADEQESYDVEGLSHHLGNGLITLGACLVAAAIALVLEHTGWFIAFIAGFLFVVVIIIIGGQKMRFGSPLMASAATTRREDC